MEAAVRGAPLATRTGLKAGALGVLFGAHGVARWVGGEVGESVSGVLIKAGLVVAFVLLYVWAFRSMGWSRTKSIMLTAVVGWSVALLLFLFLRAFGLDGLVPDFLLIAFGHSELRVSP